MTNPILTKEQAKFLEGQNISTFKGKFEVISKPLKPTMQEAMVSALILKKNMKSF